MTFMPQSQNTVDPVKLEKLAEVAIKVGLQLQKGQDLVITAPVVALPLVRLITKHAYQAGAGLVSAFYSDEETTLARYQYGSDESFDRASGWLYEGMAKAYANGAARLAVAGDNPMLLSEQDAGKVGRANRANSTAYKPALEKISNFDINWNIVSYPNPSWAKVVFPDDPEPIAIANLAKRSAWLNGERFASLHFQGPGTDLTVGLADGHEWHGGASTAKNGITCNPNIPTEEVFTTPHALRVEGHVSSTKPLSHQGTLIDNIQVRFEGGRIVEAKASRGEEVLNKVLDTDEGARRLGEVALVPHSSPISASGILFYNTLFDENASCHIALGQCYSKCFLDGATLSQEQIKAQGGNSSLIHIDWMIGSDKVDIDGLKPDGSRVPVMRQGEWA
ncbi:aminopeptidase [Rhizobium leguminosarum]|uniref:aminopeptidase n=1 Tax=Rhizobium leguminosarum TaxID=384 RepID=UPI001C95785D|nr:aminopeptidase [Rhizobium leguminosarum]MBY5899953.1 aminopeptidase [Rhizobium leguminosarum]MBY5906155.1 aminopeptidase [Rhizobium leguminosarum]